MKMDDNEFTLFCLEVSKVAAKYGVSTDAINSILAEAIKNRERVASREPVEVREYHMPAPPQALYAPPMAAEWKMLDISGDTPPKK